MTWGVVIVAAGRGARMGRAKQLIEVAGLPLAGWCMRTLGAMREIAEAVVVTERETAAAMGQLARRFFSVPCDVVDGGATRQDSVRIGLTALSHACDAVLVHDAARPLVRAADVLAGMALVGPGRAALLAAAMVDTVKVADPQTLRVERTLDRATLWCAQTPQFAMRSDLEAAHASALAEGARATDDAAVLERAGVCVTVVPASSDNFKVTIPDDLARAEALLRQCV